MAETQTDVLQLEKIKFNINGKDFLNNGSFLRKVEIQESVFSPFFSGRVLIDDPIDIRDTLNGNEKVDFSYRPNFSGDITFTNTVLRRLVEVEDGTDIRNANSKKLTYILEFINRGLVESNNSAITRAFVNKNPYEIYAYIISALKENYTRGKTALQPITLTFKNERPQTALSKLFDHIDSTHSNNNSCYMLTFYDRNQGIKTILIDELIREQYGPFLTFNRYSNLSQRTLNQDKFSIFYHKSFYDFDILERPYANLRIGRYNIKAGLPESQDVKVTINLLGDGNKIFTETFDPPVFPKSITQMYDANNNKNPNLRLELAHKHRAIMGAHLKQHRGIFRIPANSSVRLGMNCHLNIPKEESELKKSNDLNRNAGLVTVVGIKHVIEYQGINPRCYMEVEYYKPFHRKEIKK